MGKTKNPEAKSDRSSSKRGKYSNVEHALSNVASERKMNPEFIASKFPQIYHITVPGAWESIRKLGLLSTSTILDLFEVSGTERTSVEERRREKEVPLSHAKYGSLVLNDNVPLTEKALSGCLDDGLLPADWLRMLNARIFFWPSVECLENHLGARGNRGRTREVLVLDTLSLLTSHADNVELCAINSGSTIRKPARRGLKTFSPLSQYSFQEWSRLRGQKDEIKEIIVKGVIHDIEKHVVEVRTVTNP